MGIMETENLSSQSVPWLRRPSPVLSRQIPDFRFSVPEFKIPNL
jgi:hypothetical protein